MAWGLGLEPRFSDSKSDVLPIRRPPNDRSKFNVQGSGFKLTAPVLTLNFEPRSYRPIARHRRGLVAGHLTEYPASKLAWGPGVEPGFSDPESDVLPIRRSPK
jgi:hypothetical protein